MINNEGGLIFTADELQLCYAREHDRSEGGYAWFATCEPSEVCFDGWDRVCWKHNSSVLPWWRAVGGDGPGPPYALVRIAWDAPLVAAGYPALNSDFSVAMITVGLAPWLRTRSSFDGEPVACPAGMTLPAFVVAVGLIGGHSYLDRETMDLLWQCEARPW